MIIVILPTQKIHGISKRDKYFKKVHCFRVCRWLALDIRAGHRMNSQKSTKYLGSKREILEEEQCFMFYFLKKKKPTKINIKID